MAAEGKRGWQRWFWQHDATGGQKWVISCMVVTMLGAMVPMLFVRSFVPSARWQQVSWVVVALLTLGALLGMWHLYRKGQWAPSGPWLGAGPVKRVLLGVGSIAFMVLIFWMNVAQTLPIVITKLWSVQVQEPAMVKTYRSSGRYSCRYQLKVEDIRYMFFEFCIDSESYDELPSEPMPALLQVQRSFFGKDVVSLRLAVPKLQ